MKRLSVLLSGGILTLMLAATVVGGQPKVTICHAAGLANTPANWVTLELPYPAVYGPAGHFNENGTTRAGHEQDYMGACVVPSFSPPPSEKPSFSPPPSEPPSFSPPPSAPPSFSPPPSEPPVTPPPCHGCRCNDSCPTPPPSEPPVVEPTPAPTPVVPVAPTPYPNVTPPPTSTEG